MELIISDRIRNRTVKFFNDVNMQLRYDAIASSFRFGYYFNPDNAELKDMSCIGHYHPAVIRHNGQTILTGNILSEEFDDSSEQTLNSLSGGSLPGVLEDCNFNSSIQFNAQSLLAMVEQVIKPFGLKVKYDTAISKEVNEPYAQISAKPTDSIKQYLSELAAQKNVILGHDEFGNVRLRRAQPGRRPVMDFSKTPSIGMKLSFNGQAMHSELHIMEQSNFDFEIQTSTKTIKNPFVINTVYRPKTYAKTAGDTELDLDTASKNALAQELRNLQLVITVEGWMNQMKRIVMPGDIISVQNSKVYLYNRTDFFVEQVDLIKNAEQETATITCVLPSVYDGSTPVYTFRGINLH